MYVFTPQSFVVDPLRDGAANALWAKISGTGSLGLSGDSPNQFRFNTIEAVVRADLKFARVEFSVQFPMTGVQTISSLANDVEFGLKNAALGDKGKIVVFADKSENTIDFRMYDESGAIIGAAVPFKWDTAWNATTTKFIIFWANDRVLLFAGGSALTKKVAEIVRDDKGQVPRYALNPYIKVTGNDNIDIDYIAVDNAQSNSIMLI